MIEVLQGCRGRLDKYSGPLEVTDEAIKASGNALK